MKGLNSALIRVADLIFSIIGLLLLSPLFLLFALLIRTGSKGPVFFRQVRVGKNGRDFRLWKFRTMVTDAHLKGALTVGARDPRITSVGFFLRKYKLDELPQLINVLTGEMSLVGPRPEVRKYTDLYTAEQRIVLSVKPGITDLASVEYANENELLAANPDPEGYYIREVMPAKIRLNMEFIRDRTLVNYFRIILRTVFRVFQG